MINIKHQIGKIGQDKLRKKNNRLNKNINNLANSNNIYKALTLEFLLKINKQRLNNCRVLYINGKGLS